MDTETLTLAGAAAALELSRQRVHQLVSADPTLIASRDEAGRLRLHADRVRDLAIERAAAKARRSK